MTRGARLRALGALVVLVATATLLALPHSTPIPGYLQAALGPSSATAPRAVHLANRSDVSLRHDGFTLAQSGTRVNLASVVERAGSWSRRRHGLVRRTRFGFETIHVGKTSVEESLVVTHHVGQRTWRWRLSGPTLTPSLRSDGSVGFYRGTGLIKQLTTLAIDPVVVQDASGHGVTPKGAHWQVAQLDGSWWLTLTLDDTSLPTPYVIDPIAHGADLTAASQNTGGAGGTTTATGPVNVNANDTVVATFTLVKPAAASCANTTAADSVGNTLTRDAAIGPAVGTAGTCVAIFHFTYASAQTNITFTFTHDSATDRSYSLSTYTGIGGVDVAGAGNVGTTAALCAVSCTLPNGGSNTLTTGASSGDLLVEGVAITGVKNASTYTDTTVAPAVTAAGQTVSQGNSRTIAYAGYALNAAASTAYSTTGTTQSTNNSSPYAMALVAYKAKAPTSVTFSGSPQTGSARSDWTVGFTSSASGALSAGSTITVALNSGFTVPATPTIVVSSGFTNCTATATASAQTVTITLVGASCSLPASAAASLTLKGLTDPAAGTLAANTFSVATSGDPVPANPASSVVISPATPVGSVSFSGSTQSPAATANWTEGLTTSATGAMSAGDTVTVVFPAGFTVPAVPTVTLGSGFTSCTATATGSGTTATVTLVGASCSVAAGTAASLTLNGLTNPGSGSYAASGFSVKTSRDTVAVNPPSAIVISNAPTNISFSGSPQTGSARSDWTETFKTSAAGALSNGATITIVFNSGFTIPATPTITLGAGFSNCTATGVTAGSTVTVTLAGGLCAVAASTSATLTVKGLTNPAAGSLAANTFSIATSKDLIAASPASAVTISAATSVSSPTFSGSVQTGGSTANWTETFTTSASGAMAAADTISLKFNGGFTVPATPTIVLNSGFASCTAAGSTSSNVVTVTLSGASCAVANSAAVSLTVNGITNPGNGSYAAGTFSIATSRDTAAVNPSSAIAIASPVTGISFSGAPQTGGARSDWTVGFTTSSSGSLAAAGTITIGLNAGFTVPATPTVVLGSGFSNCTATGAGSGTTVTVTLAGASCALANSTAATLTVQGLTNPAAGVLAANSFSIATSGDTVSANPASAVTIAAATPVSAVSFGGAPQSGGARSTWTVSFKSSATGALRAGDAITAVFNSGLSVPATPTVALTGGFSNCTASATASAQTVTITLAGASCALPASTTATLTLAALTNPAAGSLAASTFSVKTATDTSAANPASPVTISAATAPASISFSGSTRSAGASATWTVGFSTSTTGALSAGDMITVVLPAGFTIPATPTITLPTGFTTCAATASTSGQTVTITLSDSGGTCSLSASTAGTLTIAGITNPAAGTYAGSGFTVKTSRDTAAASLGSSIDIFGAASQVVFTTQPGGGTAGTAWSTQPVVTVEDSGGRTVASYASNVTVAIKAGTGGAGATLSGTKTVAASNGVATFSGLSIDKASTTYQLHATSGALTAADSAAFTISAASAQTIALNAGNGQSATVNTNVATAPSVLVTDAYGNPVPGVSVTFAVTGGGGSLTGGSQSTDSSGVATVGSWKLGTTAGSGNNTLSATSAGLTGSPVGFTASATAGSASTLSVGAPGSATAGTAFGVTVTALDSFGNTATGYTGTVHFTGGGSGATLPANYTFTGGDNGAHTFTNGVTLTQGGNRTVTATDTVTGTIAGTSSTIAVGAAGVSSLSVVAPASATAGTAFSVTVTALDSYGNTATSYAGTVHFTGGGTGATLPSNYTFVGGDNGTHTFTNAVTLTQAGSRTVSATDTVSGSITGTSSAISVSPAGTSTLSVTAPANATAGTAFSVTVTALDAYGNTTTGYTGTVHFTGGGTGATLPADYTFTGGDNGTHTFTNAVTLTQAGSRGVTATDTVSGSITGTSSSIALSPAGASTLSVTAPASATAGTAFSVTVTALDAYGNTASGYTGTVHFTGGGTGATLPSNYTFTGGDNGTHTFTNAVTLTQSGSRTVTATDTVTGSITGTSATIALSPAGASTLSVTAPASATAGSAFSVTVTALDAYGNTASGYTGTVHFTGGGTGATLPSNYTFTGGDGGTHTFTNAVTLTQAGSRTVTAADTVTGSITGTSSSIALSPTGASTLSVTAPANATAGTAFSVTVTALDAYGNTATGYTGTVHFTGGGAAATLPSNYTFTGGDNGTHAFTSAVTLTQSGNRTVTATDTVSGSITGTSSSIAVSPAGASTLSVNAPASATAGTAFSVTVTALDAYGNTATGYTGTVHFTGGGTGATLPANYVFTGGDNGTHTFTNGATLTAAGSRTLTATDTVTASITGTSSSISVSAAGASTLAVTAPGSATAGSAFSVTVTAFDTYGNTATGYTGTVHFTGGGTSPTLPSDYTFTAGDNGTHTFSNAFMFTQAGGRTVTATDTVTGSITGTSGAIGVSPAGAATLAVSAPAGVSAGSPFSATVTALDAYGNTATGYTGTVHFTGGGTSATLPSDYTFTGGDNGAHTFTNGVTLTQSGSRTITVTDTVTGTITGTSSTITVSASATQLDVTAPASATAGTAFSVTVTAKDAFGNVAVGYTGTVHFTGGGTGPTLPSDYTFVGGDNGTHTFTNAATLTQSGSRTITATDTNTGSITGTSSTIAVSAASATTLTVTAPANATAGTAFSATVTALDAYGNTATGYTGTVHFTGGGTGATLPADYTFAGGDNGTHTFTNGATLTAAGSRTLTATDTNTGSITGTSSSISVSAAGAATFTVSAPGSATAGSAFSVTVTAKDAYGNTAVGYTGTVHFAGGGAGATLPSDFTFVGGDNGAHSFNGVTLTAAGSRAVTATDTVTGSITGTSGTITVSPAGAATLPVTVAASATAGTAFSVTVTAKDAYGNTATGYTGTVTFSGGGTGATLPADYTFAGGDNGTHTFTNAATLTQSGNYTITATDTNTGSITGTSSTIAVSAASAATLTVTAPGSATAGTPVSVSVTAIDAYGNTATGYTGTVHLTGGGTGATLPTDYTFVGGDNGTHTFTNAATLTQAGSRTITATDTNTGSVAGTSGTIAVAPAGAATLTVTAPGSATAGTPFSATVTAKDAYGNTATGYAGTVHFTGGGTSPALPSNYTFTGGDNGTHTFASAVTLTQAGNRTLTATDTVTGSITGTSGTITVSASVLDASVSTVGASPASVTADGSSTSTITVTANDAFGNPLAGATTSLSQGTGNSNISPASTSTNASGVATFTVKDTTAETATYQATVSSTLLTQTANVQFVPGAADGGNTTIDAAPASIPADGGSTSTITVHAKDAQGNALTSSGGVVTLSTDHGSLSSVTDNGDGSYTATLTASTSIQTATVTGTIGGNAISTGASVSFTGVPSKYLVTSSDYAPTANAGVTITAQLADQNDNPTGVAGKTITWSKTGPGGSFSSPTAVTNASGIATVTFTTGPSAPATYTVTATDDTTPSHLTGTSSAISTSVGGVSAADSTVEATPSSIPADGSTTSTVTVTVTDSLGNPIPGKTVSLSQPGAASSSTSSASGPSDSNGRVTFTVSDAKGETVTYTATDATDSVTLTHTASVNFVDSVPPAITPAGPADGATGAGTVTLAASGVGDPGSGVASVTFFYCDSTSSACTPTSGTSIAGVDGGGGSWTAALDTTTLTDGHSYSWLARAADNAGNHTDTTVRTLSVDNSTPTLTLGTPIPGTSPGSQYYDSSSKTVWLNSSDSGSFQLAASASDAQSGVSNVRFSALLGTAVTNDATSPYESAAYTFAPGSNSGTVNVTAFNGASVGTGANSAAGAFTIAADTAAPGAFPLGAPADASKIGTGVTVSAAPSDGQSGLRQVAFYYCDLSGGPCAPSIQIGLTQTVPAAGVYAVNWDTTGLTDGHSYAVDAVATDNVGHTTSSTASTVTVDNSAPAIALAAPAAITGGAYQSYDGADKRLWLNANQSGSFTLRANASDADSGIASVTFPSLLGTSANAGTLNGGVYESSTYSFNNPSAPGSKTIVAANGVTNPAAATASDSIDVEVDGSSPTTIQTFPLDNGSYQSGTWNGNCTPSGICGTVTDGGSGVAQVNVSIKDRTTGKYWGGTAFDQATQTFNAASVAGNNWHYALAESDLTSPHAYLVEIYAVDNVGNADVHQQFRFTFGSDTGGPSDTLSLTNATHAYLTATAPYVLYYGTTTGGGGFKLHASATDPSGVDTVTFPDLSGATGFSGAGGSSTNGSNADPYTADSPAYGFTGSATTAPAAKNVDSADLRGNVSHDQVSFVLDNAAPTGGSLSVNGGNAYSTTTSFAVSHVDYTLDAGGSGVASSILTVAAAALSNDACGTFGSSSPASDGTFNGSDATCYRFTLTGTDNVGNVATKTVDVKVDTTAPSQPAVTFGNLSTGNTYDDGAGTLYYRPSAGGTFRVDAASTDAESGVQGYTYSPLSGFASTSQSGGSLSATFNAASTGSGAFTVHATNNAGLDSSGAGYNVTPDSTAPSGGSLTVNGTAASGAGSSSYLSSGGSVTVSTTPYSDGGSGLASQVVTVQQATLSNDACGTYGGSSVVGGASYGVSSGNCYLFTITATDNVGNVTTERTTVKVDTTAPVAPGISFTGASAGNTFVSGSTLYYRPSAGGAFTVNATGASDPETGIAGYTFSTLSGFTTAAQTGNHVDITFDGSSTGGGAYTVVASNNAGVSSTPATAFSITKDSTAPSGGLLSINPYSSSLSVAIAKTDFSDAGSGIASNAVTRSDPQAPVAGACPVGGYTGTNAVTLPDDTVPADGECYRYTLTGIDNVGNAGTYSTNVLVDTTGPTGGSVSYADGGSSLSAISVDWDAGTDAESGIAQVRVDRASASVSGGACGSLGGFSTIVANATVSPVVDSSVSAGNCYAYRIVVTNNAGVSSTFTSTSVTQLTTAVPFEIANTIPSGASLQGSTLYLGPAAANQPWKLQLTTDGGNGVTQATWQGKSGSPLSSAPTTDSVPTNAPFSSGVYTWDGTPVNDTIQLTRDPGAQVDLVRVVSDLTAPTGSVTYTNGTYASHSVHITTSASDADSGVATTQVQRASAPLTGATCGSWTGYSDVTLDGGGNDTTVADNTCYRYQLVVTDNVGNQFTAGSANIAEIPDITPPTFVSAATNVAGTQLTITMSEPLDTGATTPAGAFTVTYDGVAEPTSGISISGSTVTLDLVDAPDNSQVVKVSYAQPSSTGDRMRDLATPAENETASFGPEAAANNTPDSVAPTVTSTSVNGSTLTLVFNEALAGAAPDPSAFTITAGAKSIAVTNVTMSGTVVTLTLASPVSSADAVDVSYAVPALNALHDSAGNATAPFTRAAANQTPVVAPPAVGGAVIPAAPGLMGAAPLDGSTVQSVSTISLDAGQAGTWTNMTVTRPDGSRAALPDAWGSTAAWPFAGADPGLYVVRGTLTAGGQSVDVLSHFTIWTPSSGTAIAPAVEKNASPATAGELTSADGLTDVSWPAGAFDDEVVVDVRPHAATDFPSVPKTARLVSVTAFLRSTHAQVTSLNSAIDIRFANASPTAHPLTSEDGKTWSAVPQLQTLSLGAAQSDGWFRDSDGTVHVLARHLSYYALVGEQASTTLALRVQTVRRLWLAHRSFIAVRISVTMPARVTGNFVATDGTVVPGQTVKTPTRHAGVTILRIPLHVTKAGVYRLQMHAEGGGQAVDRTATIRFLPAQPGSPVWQTGALRVAVIRGAGALHALGSRLGRHFLVRRISDAELYRAVDAKSPTAAAAVVVDLSTVPPYTLAELHALLPEVQIIGLGGSPARTAYYRSIGISTLLPHGASAKRVAAAVRGAVR